MALLDRYLTMCLAWCDAGSKAHAWKLAQEMALKHPELLGSLPDLLTATMKAKANDQQGRIANV